MKSDRMKITINFTGIFTTLGLIAGLFIFTSFSTDEKGNTYNFPDSYRIVSPTVPSKVDFCGERVPVDNFEVYERLDRELTVNTYWHSYTINALKNSERWFSVIEPILEKNGIPSDFKYLCVIESNLSNASSPKGAIGFWQFIYETGKKYGLEINSEVDERYNVEKSTEAACKYLKEAYEKFSNWTLAAASYNMGMNGLSFQLERQRADNYYSLVLSEETSRYIFRLLAVKEIMLNPEKYGFHLRPTDIYPPVFTREVEITHTVKNLAEYSESLGINYKILKTVNPWLRDNKLTLKKKKSYTIKIPTDGIYKIITKDDLLYE